MKHLIFILFAIGTFSTAAKCATSFSDSLNNMWLAGDKAQVLATAKQRLQSNSNDIAGLVITMEYYMEFSDIVHLKDSIDKVIAAGSTLATTQFAKLFPKLKSDLMYIETSVLPSVSAEMAAAESPKGDISGKPMDFLYVLQAAETDGLIH